MARYIVNNSKFKPFSYAEMLAPVQMADTEHKLMEERLGELSTKASMLDRLANLQPNSSAYNQYNSYSNDLSKQVELLASQGLTPDSRSGLLNMKKRYASEITPIEVAINKLDELTKAQREAIQRDPSLMFDINYGKTSVDDILNNPNPTYNTISGSELTKRSSLMAQNLAKIMQDNPQYKSILKGQYIQQMQQLGYNPQQVIQSIMDDPNAPQELKQIRNTIWKEAGLDNWDKENQSRAVDYINAGLYDALGTKKYDVQADRSYISPAEAARLRMEQERLTLAKEQAAKDKSTVPLPDGSVIRVIGGGKALRIYPDGKVENFTSKGSTKSTSINDVIKKGTEPIIIANTNGKWRAGSEGEDVKKTMFGMTRSNVVSGYGNYSLDNVNPDSIVTNYNEIPKDALKEIANTAKKQDIDLKYYNIIKVKASDKRAAGNYDYVLMPKTNNTSSQDINSNSSQITPNTSTNNFDVNMGI